MAEVHGCSESFKRELFGPIITFVDEQHSVDGKQPRGIDIERKRHFLQYMEKHTNNIESYMDGFKSKEKKYALQVHSYTELK